jgi:hypothetical protein
MTVIENRETVESVKFIYIKIGYVYSKLKARKIIKAI